MGISPRPSQSTSRGGQPTGMATNGTTGKVVAGITTTGSQQRSTSVACKVRQCDTPMSHPAGVPLLGIPGADQAVDAKSVSEKGHQTRSPSFSSVRRASASGSNSSRLKGAGPLRRSLGPRGLRAGQGQSCRTGIVDAATTLGSEETQRISNSHADQICRASAQLGSPSEAASN